MRKFVPLTLISFFSIITGTAVAQCAVGEIEVQIDVLTDDYGYEAYWQLLPAGNACGTGTIFEGGNMTMDCNSGGLEIQEMSGYDDNTTISEGPWCLTEGADYDIFLVDDWADGGTRFVVNVNGYPMYDFKGDTSDERFTFTAENPPPIEVELQSVLTPLYAYAGDITVSGTIKNRGTGTLTSFDLEYYANSGSPVIETVSSISVTPFTDYYFEHSVPLNLSTPGLNSITVTVSNFNNSGADNNQADNSITKNVHVNPAIPNLVNNYISQNYTLDYQTISSIADQLDFPRDLDFHPNGELWVINMNLENTGGSTVTYTSPGGQNQTSLWRRDGNAWHFMSLPTGIAFSNNGNFATSTGIFDANHTGGSTAFTGPTLWSSDSLIYAQPSGGNGSHLDMLHESPYCMGIASEKDNVFWVMDAWTNDVVRYDFVNDHGPGQHDHSDGIIRRYPEISVDMMDTDIPCHLAFDDDKKWLYVVDGAGQRVVRLDITTGTLGGNPAYPAAETLAEYTNVTGVTHNVVVSSGLVKPSGIAVIGDRMLVSDFDNGDIIVYDISSMPATELGRIATGTGGIMGIAIGPEGDIWYVNGEQNAVMKISAHANSVGLDEIRIVDMNVYPNPTSSFIKVWIPGMLEGQLDIFDVSGRKVFGNYVTSNLSSVDMSSFSKGLYTISFTTRHGNCIKKVVLK